MTANAPVIDVGEVAAASRPASVPVLFPVNSATIRFRKASSLSDSAPPEVGEILITVDTFCILALVNVKAPIFPIVPTELA